MAQISQGGESKTRITVQVSDRRKMEINQIAYELSKPGENVSASQLVREAIDLYIEQFATDPSKCDPRNRGSLGGESFVEIEVDEGAA